MALALHPGAARGYAGAAQARPAFAMPAAAAAVAAAAAGGRPLTGGRPGRSPEVRREADPSGAFS